MAWEKKVGFMGDKRRTVEPLHQATTSKLQKMTNSIGFGERQKVMEDWNEEEDDKDDAEFWRNEAASLTEV